MEILQNLKDWTSSSTCLVSIFINFFLSNSVQTFNWNSDGGRIYSERCASLHFCVRWPCFGARFLGTLIWSRPRERERERVCEGWGQCGLLSLTETVAREQKALHRRATHLESERYVQEYQTNIKMAQTQIWPHRYHLKWTFKYMTERREGKL